MRDTSYDTAYGDALYYYNNENHNYSRLMFSGSDDAIDTAFVYNNKLYVHYYQYSTSTNYWYSFDNTNKSTVDITLPYGRYNSIYILTDSSLYHTYKNITNYKQIDKYNQQSGELEKYVDTPNFCSDLYEQNGVLYMIANIDSDYSKYYIYSLGLDNNSTTTKVSWLCSK